MKLAVIRREHFNAAHRLHNTQLSDAENARLYDKCNSPNFHGHNYVLDVKVVGPINPETGYVMDMKHLKNIIWEKALIKFDHKNLNLDTEAFRDLIPTAENIAVVIYNLLRPAIPSHLELFIRLQETDKNMVEYPVQ